ncbi:hypothetical protein DL771_001245 [Monosporascus sp. 5C6A]|nr:hypothetical protein DL771_001245 [Monosporascus sp. 5C6A]
MPTRPIPLSSGVYALYLCLGAAAAASAAAAAAAATVAAQTSPSHQVAMPPGRPPKRSGDSVDVESPDGQLKCKIPRLDRSAPNDFSSVVKSKLQSYTRTGQACDRCKVRKIRCDALPEGCSHCINQNLECYVTDRVTGRTERRGYMQELEREKTDMLNHIRALEKLLANNGVDVKPWQWSSYHSTSYPSNVVFDSAGNPISDPTGGGHNDARNGNDAGTKESWASQNSPSSTWAGERSIASKAPMAGISQSIADPKPADARLGVSADQAPLSSIKGTTLSILGSTIDINSFEALDVDEPPPNAQVRTPLYNKSVQAMLQSAMNVNPPLHVEYPPRADAFTYAEWYFLMIYPFLPILHKPTFMDLLTRLYDDPSFVPTPAETVMVHMVYATIYLQYGIRQESPEQRARLHKMSNNHYHFALSKLFDLATARTIDDLQAMTMIALHTSRFPKSDSSNMLTCYALSIAMGLGLHRAYKKPGEGTNLENEMRKRIWWVLAATAIVLNGRLGRPMPLRLEECDVEFPEPIADELLTRDGVDTSRVAKCPFEAGIACHKIAALFLEMYSNIYAARRDPRRYVPIVEALEEQLQDWKDNLPDLLRIDDLDRAEHEGHMMALYIQLLSGEFRLCLRHPSVALTSDPKMLAENARICEETAKDMLKTLRSLYRLKSLDTTWYCLAVYIAAIFTTLAVHWERRYEATAAEVQILREDMNSWLLILAETGNLMGCGLGPRDAVSSVIDRTIAWIEHDRIHKGGASVPPPAPPITQDMLKHSPRSPTYNVMSSVGPSRTPSQAGGGEHPNGSTNQAITATAHNNFYSEVAHEPGTYHQPIQYGDCTTQSSGNVAYDHNGQYLYAQTAGHVAAAQAQAQAHAHAQAQAHAHRQARAQAQTAQAHIHAPAQPTDHHSLTTFAAQATQMTEPSQPQSPADMMWRLQPSHAGANTVGLTAWQDWTAAIVDSQDRFSASALMSLGGAGSGGPRTTHAGNMSDDTIAASSLGIPVSVGLSGVNGGNTATTSAAMQWPLLLFSDGPGVGGP